MKISYFAYTIRLADTVSSQNLRNIFQRKISNRKLNRQRSVFPSEQALLKALYLATFEATKKWTQPLSNWSIAYGEMCIMYEGRLPD